MKMQPQDVEAANLWQQLGQWFESNGELLGWLFVGSIASLVLCALLLPVVVMRLPPDYFASSRDQQPPPRHLLGWLWRIVKNVLGVVFVLAGVAMLILPGQGLLTILIGLMMVDIPGKRAVERRIVARPMILRLLNKMRASRGRAPLIVD